MYHLILTSLILSLLSSSQIIANQQSVSTEKAIKISDDLIPLVDLLLEKGFKVKFQNPPKTGVYGLFHSKSKTLWVAPISFELGIGRHTFLHEATHAAQSCPYGSLTLIGWELPLSPFIRNEIQTTIFTTYDNKDYAIEKEAFSLQGQKNAIDLLLKALNQRCK